MLKLIDNCAANSLWEGSPEPDHRRLETPPTSLIDYAAFNRIDRYHLLEYNRSRFVGRGSCEAAGSFAQLQDNCRKTTVSVDSIQDEIAKGIMELFPAILCPGQEEQQLSAWKSK